MSAVRSIFRTIRRRVLRVHSGWLKCGVHDRMCRWSERLPAAPGFSNRLSSAMRLRKARLVQRH